MSPCKLLKILLIAFAGLTSASGNAQLEVNSNSTVENLVNNILLGSGINAENITFNGLPASTVSNQIGIFSNNSSNIPLNNGIILATGNITVAEGPNDILDAFHEIDESLSLDEDADLQVLLGNNVMKNAAILEFDFVAVGDTMRFNYVFASEEYNEYVCSNFNDVFGFFISGAGIAGNEGFLNNAENIAIIPGTNTNVAINSLNRGVSGLSGAASVCNAQHPGWQNNSIYFIDNENNTDPNSTQFDGFTVKMPVKIALLCGETYHIKIAIADAVDRKNDSAVFIESQSFASLPSLTSNLEINNAQSDTIANEGCSGIVIDLFRDNSEEAGTYFLNSTELNALFPQMPESVSFDVGEDSLQLVLDLMDNNLTEGLREIQLKFMQISACGTDTSFHNIPLNVSDSPPFTIVQDTTVNLNCDDEAFLNPQVYGGTLPYNFQWSNGSNSTTFLLDPEIADTVYLEVSDQCNAIQEMEIIISRNINDPLQVFLADSIGFNCKDTLWLSPQVMHGTEPYTYNWILDNQTVSSDSVFSGFIYEEQSLQLSMIDACGDSASANIYLYDTVDKLNADLGDDFAAHCMEEIDILPQISGGFGNKQYSWTHNGISTSNSLVYSLVSEQNAELIFTVTDECGNESSDTLQISSLKVPIHIELPSDTTFCAGDVVNITADVMGGSGSLKYFWNNEESDQASLEFQASTDFTCFLRVNDECSQVEESFVNVSVIELIADFEHIYISPEEIELKNLSSSQCYYDWTFGDGSTSSLFSPSFDPSNILINKTTLEVSNYLGCSAAKTLNFDPPMSIFIPSAFSPDGDGLNDRFMAVGNFVAEFRISVYDRWGNLVFEGNDLSDGWNGSYRNNEDYAQPNEIFNYQYVAKSFSGYIEERQGMIHVIR